MNIHLRFFASVRELLGVSQETITVSEDVKTVGDVRAHLAGRGGVWAEALCKGRLLRMACNQQMTDEHTPIREGCEIAFFPPVTGG